MSGRARTDGEHCGEGGDGAASHGTSGEAEARLGAASLGRAAEQEPRGDGEGGGSGAVGTVHLVGAGPGDPRLLTMGALDLIASADVILYDRLIPEHALDCAPEETELVFVGKQGGGPSIPQEQIEAMMIERAREGLTVVRLKGGDPFVFGRGGEEALALRQAGIPFDVTPGVSAGVAATAYAGIPVTHRGLARAVAFVTAHTGDGDELDWQALAAFPGTLVFYMGVRRLAEIADALIAAGASAQRPAAVVERGTLPSQRSFAGPLAQIAQIAQEQRVRAPAITIVGEVVALGEQLAWRQAGPLHGVTVAVTRARAEASALAARLQRLGANAVQAPSIRIAPLEEPIPPLDRYDLLCLTSGNGVDALFERLRAEGRDARALAGLTVAAIGPATAAALERYGIAADVVAERFVAEGLIEALEGREVSRALLATAVQARDALPRALRERGAEVDVLALYETVPMPLDEQALADALNADYITFTSSSTVRFFLQSAGDEDALRGPGAPRIASIGPLTTETLREHGLEPAVQASRHDVDGLLAALLEDVRSRR